MPHSQDAFDKIVTLMEYPGSLLDIGCGTGRHSNQFFQYDYLSITGVDINPADKWMTRGDYNDIRFAKKFDTIWCAHVLEHQHNVQNFLKKVYDDLKEGGWLAITVPPRKDEIVGGHVSLWNAGLLVYNLVLAGFDCSDCKIKSYGYNVSVLVKKKPGGDWAHRNFKPALRYGKGDIELLAPYFPPNCRTHGFSGVIEEWNWS